MAARNQDVTEADIGAWCGDYLAKGPGGIRCDSIVEDESFAVVGHDSAEPLSMVTAAEDWLGLELGSKTAIEHPSVTEFPRFIMTRLAE